MTEELDVVFFDLGGTLIDMSVSRESVWAEALSRHGADVEAETLTRALRKADRDLDEAFADIQGVDEGPFWKRYDAEVVRSLGLGIDPEDVEADLSASFDKIIPDESLWKDYQDAKPTLDALAGRDIEVGLISNATDLARRVLRRLDMEKYFDPIIISSEIGHRKPEREIFDIALNEAGAAPSRALYIGDKYAVDVKGANRAGMNTVLIDRGNVFPDASCVRISDLSALRTFL
jgi:HAD superfamily hydrolase (TIGR01549 family)